MPNTIDPTRASALRVAPDLTGTTIAVTGANGFVGARLCALLAATGAAVRAVVRRPGTAPVDEGIVEVVADLEEQELEAAFGGCDVVVHTVSIIDPDLATSRVVNVEGTAAVLAAASAAAVARVVHLSSVVVYPLDEVGSIGIDEDTPLVGDDGDPYAVSKREAEEVVAAAPEGGPDTVVLRPPAILGWGPTSFWGQRLPAQVSDGVFGEVDEREPLGWVHVDDVAAAIALAATSPVAAGRTYLVSAGDTTWGTYLGAVHPWFPDAPSPLTQADEPPAPWHLVTDRVRHELGWVPTVDLDTTMAEIAAHHD